MSGLLGLAALGAALTGSAVARGQAPELRLEPAVVTGAPGDTVGVEVRMSSTDPITALQFTLDFDSTQARFLGAGIGSDLEAAGLGVRNINDDPFWDPPTPGTNDNVLVQLAGGATSSISGSHLLAAVVSFELVAAQNDSSLLDLDPHCSHTQLVTPELDTICSPALQLQGAILQVVQPLTIDGTALYFGANHPPIPGAQISALQDSTLTLVTTDATGTYAVTDLTNGVVTLSASRATSSADENVISGHDAVLTFRIVAGLADSSYSRKRSGNVTSPEVVSLPALADAVAIAQWLAFIVVPDNHTGAWVFDFPDSTAPDSADIVLDFADSTVNVTGYVLGDVDGSWPSRLPTAPPFRASFSAPPTLSLEEASREGDELQVRVMTQPDGQPLESIVYSLTYTDDALQYLGSRTGARTRDFFTLDNPVPPGVVHGVLLGTTGLAEEPGEVLAFRFRIVDAKVSASVSFSRLVVNDRNAERIPRLILGGDSPGLASLPRRLRLANAPNPFHPSTRIEYGIPRGGGEVRVSLDVYDASGRLVRVLLRGQPGPGLHDIRWDGLDDRGRPVGAGVYFLRLRAGEEALVRKTTLVK